MAKKLSFKERVQHPLPGTAPERNQRVEDAATHYAEKRDHRIAWGKDEKEAHQSLLEVMLEEGVEHYHVGNVEVHLGRTSKCKVKIDGNAVEETTEGGAE